MSKIRQVECAEPGCTRTFEARQHVPKKYCDQCGIINDKIRRQLKAKKRYAAAKARMGA